MFFKKYVLKNSTKSTGEYLCRNSFLLKLKNETSAQAKFLKNIIFTEHLRADALQASIFRESFQIFETLKFLNILNILPRRFSIRLAFRFNKLKNAWWTHSLLELVQNLQKKQRADKAHPFKLFKSRRPGTFD